MVITTLIKHLRLANPLSCLSEELPFNVVLMVKLIAVGLILKDYLHELSQHFLPFLPIFDHMGSSYIFHKTLQIFFILGTAGILLTNRIRISCLILGMVFFIYELSSKTIYTNVAFFCAAIFIFVSLSNLTLLRYQMAIIYLGAGVNKLFDVDWRSGQYFEHWMSSILKRETYVHATTLFSPMLLSKIMCWLTIYTEFFIMAAIIIRPINYLAIWVAVYFHSTAFIIANYDFRVFTIAILASYLIFVNWPKRLTVFFNSHNNGHQYMKSFFEWVDWDKQIQWQPATGQLKLEADDKSWDGILALKKLVLYTPFFYFCYAIILGLPDQYIGIKLKIVEGILLLFLPWPEIIWFLKERNSTKQWKT